MGVLRANVGGTWVDVGTGTDVRVWNGAWGIVAQSQITATQSGITTEVALTSSGLGVATVAGRRYRISINCSPLSDTAGNSAFYQIRRDGVVIGGRVNSFPYAGTTQEFHLEATWTETTSSNRAFDVTLQRLGSGTVSNSASTAAPTWVTVEDMGPTLVTVLPPQVPVANPGNALGIIAVGAPVSRAGVAITTTENLGPPINVYTQVGRRYKFRANGMRAMSASPTGYIALFFTGPGISGRVDWYTLLSAAYGSLSAEVIFDGQGSIGTYTVQVSPQQTSGTTIWTEPAQCGYYIEDLGPSSPVSVADIAIQAVPWTALPFATGWSVYGGGFAIPGYRKIGDIVYLRGLCAFAAGAATTIATLPAGFRPANTELLVADTSVTGGGQANRVDVTPAGVITAPITTTPAGWVSLSPLQFSVTA
jgi:hypothetical protein